MSSGITENIGKSFDFAKTRLVSHWLDWVILIILSIIPIIGYVLLSGFITRVYRGGEAKLGEWIRMLSDGILMCIINIVYFVVPATVLFIISTQTNLILQTDPETAMGAVSSAGIQLVNLATMMNPDAGTVLVAGVLIIGTIITLIVAIIFGILGWMAMVRFAKEESFGAAFQFGEIFKIIGKIGWVHYILSLIVLMIILCVIAILMIILISSVTVIFWTLLLILDPLISIWIAKFFSNLYESA